MKQQPPHSASDTAADPRWQAVLARDAAADGQFVYAVHSTGIYCRPSCPSRHARPENVRFYPDAAAAAHAGFRPCRRCRPDGPSPAAEQAALVARLCRLIEDAEQPPTLAELAVAANLSPYHLQRVFKAATGVSPKAYASASRAARMRQSLQATPSVTEAIYQAGYNASSRFYEQSAALLGMTPGDWRAGGKQQNIRFALAQCSLGAILVAQSARGICAIQLGDDADSLLRELQDRFPAANLIGGDSNFEQLVAQVVGFVEAPQQGLSLPLDIRGTAFQQRVWQVLQTIPPGQTLSYSEVAQRIGSPRAVRAVAQACAANALAVAIPCHRVVRTDGSLSGYRWGVARKAELLAREAAGQQKARQ
ncbi:bifunctional DNA-binding transcriptional regulator/O6-methylguanine-DNA methyltransferase Ada [Vogesella oryzae]|uniref:bifunctional DNA-binding transcriptional regulator/O6-methylguanine-DNA methyltransferase Ada n=1 Tax=Vogesella oryzae TaxID=1735285 RepID=UPI00158300D8|nr:bifunctional DNA-binding transcriptional regulator/O6-methylguanine-DNA methyltransferase Ada [Vogesella oryzae]